MPSSVSQSPSLTARPLLLNGSSLAVRAKHLFAVIHRIHHHDLEEVFELALEELHERPAELGAGVAGPGFERRDVVLGDVEPACQLALGEMVLLAHCLETDRPD